MDFKVAILVSGKGRTLKYFLSQDPQEKNFEITVVIADKWCPAIEVAHLHGVPFIIIGRCASQGAFTLKLLRELRRFRINLVVMAGFMKLLGPAVFGSKSYEGRVLNSHPALPGKFPGKDAVGDAYAAWVAGKIDKTGFTIMLADAGMDTGRPLAWGEVPFLPGDTPEKVRARIQVKEIPVYYDAVRNYIETLLEG